MKDLLSTIAIVALFVLLFYLIFWFVDSQSTRANCLDITMSTYRVPPTVLEMQECYNRLNEQS